MKKKKKEKFFLKKSKKPKSMPSVVFRRDHLRFTSGIVCGSGSFAVQFGDHFRSGDHLRRCTVISLENRVRKVMINEDPFKKILHISVQHPCFFLKKRNGKQFWGCFAFQSYAHWRATYFTTLQNVKWPVVSHDQAQALAVYISLRLLSLSSLQRV